MEALMECGGKVRTGVSKALGHVLAASLLSPTPRWTSFPGQALTLQGLCVLCAALGPGAKDLTFNRSFQFDPVLSAAVSGASSVVESCQNCP